MSSVKLTGDDLHRDSTSVDVHGFTIVHGDHGLTEEHASFIKSVMDGFEYGEFICASFELPDSCPPLLDALWGPINGDSPVDEPEVFYQVRGDRSGESRMTNRPLRECRNIVIIGQANKILWTAYGSLAGVVAPRELFDPFFNDPNNAEAKAEAEAIWKEHALAGKKD
jgi:hypothetical protein